MAKYNELHAKFLAWNNAHDQCQEYAGIRMIEFFNGFKEYLEAPPSFSTSARWT